MKTQISAISILGKVVLLAALLALGLGLQTANAAGPVNWYVNSAFDDATCSTTHFCKTVQNAVTLASAGDVVVVTPGTYTEQVEIAKDLTLTGAVSGGSIIKSPASLDTKFTTSGPNKPIVYARDSTVTIKYLTVDGDGKGNANYRIDGIAFNNAGGTIDHVTITRVRETPASGNQQGVGLFVNNGDAAARTVTVTNNVINDFQKNGMTLAGANLTVNVSNNTVTGLGAVNFIAQNGIQVSSGAKGTVGPNNVVSNLSYTANNTAATGFLIYGDVAIHHNTVTDAKVGIYFVQGDTTISNNIVTTSQSNVGTSAFWGILAIDPPLAVPSPFDAETVTGKESSKAGATEFGSILTMKIANNTVTATGSSVDSSGIESDAGYAGTETLNLSVTGNKVTGWGSGVTVYQCTSGCSGSTFSSAVVQNNVIQNNTIGLYSNTVVDATKNWWGSAAGPGGSNNGTDGGGVITTTPYATALTTSTTASTHELGEASTLQTNVTVNGIYGAQLRVTHDSSVLNFTSGTQHNVGGFFWDILVEPFIAVTSPNGTRLSGSMSSEYGHSTAVDLTDANLATWNYQCTGVGASGLSYDTTTGGLGTKLADINGFEIPAALLGDSVTCTARTGSVSGTIDLQGRLQNAALPAGWNGTVITLTCVAASGCDGFGPYVFVTGTDGLYALTKAGAGTGIATGTYNATAVRRAYLSASKASVVVTQSGILAMTTPRLKGGDINNDGAVTILDLTAIGGSFGTTITADTGVDINGDGVVNIFDLAMTGGNFGATPTWP